MASDEDDDDNWPTSGKQFALPQRDETDFGKAQERGMSLVGLGDFGKIRTVEWEGPSGGTSVHRLRTRGGWPVFEEDVVEPGETLYPRGFVAKVHNGRAILFNPYTLDILITPYLPAVNEYTVLDFATDWNVPPTDTTGWNDVVLFNGQEIRINNLAMPSLGITADHGYLAVPYVINRNDNSDQYGNAIRNETEKRVFAIGREKATTWGGAGETVILEPQGPRNAAIRTALTIGQKLNFTDDSAQIGQLFYPWEDLYPWYDDNVEWYFTSANVQMLLASTYLVKTQGNANVVMYSPPFDDLGYVTGKKRSQSFGFGITDIGASGPSYHIDPSSYSGGGRAGIIRYGMDDVVKGEVTGYLETVYRGYHYGGSVSDTEVAAGVTLEYSAHVDWRRDTRTNYYAYPPQFLSFNIDISNYSWQLNAYGSAYLFWGIIPPGSDPSITTPYRGVAGRYLLGNGLMSDSIHSGTGDIQEGEFLVTANGRDMIVIDYESDTYSGEGMAKASNLNYYQPYFKRDIWSAYGWGFLAEAIYGNYNEGGVSNVSNYKHPQDSSTIAEIDSEWERARDALLAQRYYDSEASSGTADRNFYLFTKINGVDTITKKLNWETHDFILHDETNGVYVEVVGRYIGTSNAVNNVGNVTVRICVEIETRYDKTSILLKEYTYGTVGFPFPLVDLTGDEYVYGIPSPKVRAIFAPLHREQGSFKGGHYVELSEEANGAQPVHLFNFILRLLTYYDIPEANELNDTTDIVYFVPCNLIEMLYAIVYSSEFGVNAFERYPVTFPVRYTEITTTLFAERFRIAVRDGVEGVWSDVFGADFAATGEITLHRT